MIYENFNSEDLMKLIAKNDSIEKIANTFDISEKKLNDILKNNNISNIHLEQIYRNLISILYYTNYKYPELNERKLKNLINLYIKNSTNSLSSQDYYMKKLRSLNWLTIDYRKCIIEKNIDLNYRLTNNYNILKDIDKIAYNNRQELAKDFQENKKFYIMKY